MSTGGDSKPSELGSVDDPGAISAHDEVECLWWMLGCTHDHRAAPVVEASPLRPPATLRSRTSDRPGATLRLVSSGFDAEPPGDGVSWWRYVGVSANTSDSWSN